MNSRLRQLLYRVWESLWLIPAIMTTTAMVAAAWISGLVGDGSPIRGDSPRFAASEIAGVLTTLAAGAITVGAVVFSITMLVLSSASSQFGPRLLSNFMRKTRAKLTIGGFVGSFGYQIVVAAALALGHPVPDLAVWLGLIGGLAVFALLLVFLQMVSEFIRVPFVVDEVAQNLIEALKTSRERREASAGEETSVPERSAGQPIRSERSGYLQIVDSRRLLALARELDGVILAARRAGKFVCAGEILAHVVVDAPLEASKRESICDAFALGPERTPQQDLEFALKQLVEIAAKAMSPGINDPYTAINVIDRLTGALAVVLDAPLDAGLRHEGSEGDGERGPLRVVLETTDISALLDAALHPLREHVRGSEMVSIALMSAYAKLAALSPHAAFAEGLVRHARLLDAEFERGDHLDADREALRSRFEACLEATRFT